MGYPSQMLMCPREQLTARLAHLDQQYETGEISPSFLSGPHGARSYPAPPLATKGSLKSRDRKASTPATKISATATGGKLTPPTTSALPRVVPGWRKPSDPVAVEKAAAAATTSTPTTTASPAVSPVAVSAPVHPPNPGPIAPPSLVSKVDEEPEQSAWRGAWGAVGETWARAAAKGGKTTSK